MIETVSNNHITHKNSSPLADTEHASISPIKKIVGDGRLALIVTTLGWGGTERYVEDLSIAYSRLGMNPLVIVDSPPLVRKDEIEAQGVEVVILDVRPNIKRNTYRDKLQDVLISKDIQLVHANQWERFEWSQDICVKNNIPFITTHHCTVLPPNLRQFVNVTNFRGWKRFWAHKIRALCTKPNVISISQKSAYGVRRLWGKSVNTSVVHVGVKEMPYRAHPEDGVNEPVFLSAGSLTTRKRPMLMLQAFARVLKAFPNASLVITGEGPQKAAAEKYANSNMPGKVEFLGYTDDFEKVLGAVHCFVMSSAEEGLPAVILEAMAAGLPVVTTDCGAVREVVADNHTGLIVPVDNEMALAKAMKKLAGDPMLRKSMGVAGYERWQSSFKLEHMVNNTLRAYSTLLNN